MNLSEFLPDIYIEAPGCPESVALNALRYTLRDFCERSRVWQKRLDDITPTSGYDEYDIDTQPGSEVASILSATYAGLPAVVKTETEMDAYYADWRSVTGPGVTVIIPGRTSFRVYPTPSEDDSYAVSLLVALKPTMAATTCADVVDNWRDGIAAGALSRLKKIPGKPWTDREASGSYRADFERSLGDAIASVARGNTAKSLMVEPQAFGQAW